MTNAPSSLEAGDTIVTCTVERPSWNLWVTIPGSDIVVRLRGDTFYARKRLAKAAGDKIALAELRSLLPAVRGEDFKPVNASPPEVRADVEGWHISAMLPAPLSGARQPLKLVTRLQQWACANLAGAGG